MFTNTLFVWQVRVWMLALAAVLVYANATQPAGDKAGQQLGISDAQPCLTARGPVVKARLTTAGAGSSATKCREAKVERASAAAEAVGG